MEKSVKNTLYKDYQSLIERHKSEVKKSLADYLHISKVGIDEILSAIQCRCFETGTILVKPGQVSYDCCLILKGCVRQYHLQDGVEKTTFFLTPLIDESQ